MTLRVRTQEEMDAETRGLGIALIVMISVMISVITLFIYLANEHFKKQPDYQLRQYQEEINKIETENKIKIDTEAARLKLIQLHEQRLKELE